MHLNLLIVCAIVIKSTCGSSAIKREIFFNNFNAEVHPVPNYHAENYQYNKFTAPSPAEIAAAISAAKEASANVIEAQHRVHLVKQDVLSQQKIANQKEAAAALALQQTEAAAAVQRQQASAAAHSVVLAQQRLAHAKSDVAEQQRIAAEKEATAASIIQRAANAAALQIQRTEKTAAKFAAIHNSGAAAALKHIAAAKDATLGATSAAVHASAGPWAYPPNVLHLSAW
ncbi:hypothetical protein RN001_012885 [Aquatica leii]|uniref:Cuticle protein n=1 Tax=Aquatica leii TaxID=1421715 RepID=A0AAN7SMN2_9COLE|nr:hypothetical protein RN001_012885 [Aquatica leii]